MYYCSKKENTVKIKTVVFLDDDTDTVQYRPSRSPSSSFYAPAVVPHHAHSSIIIMHHQYTVPPRIMYAYTHTDELLSMIARARSYHDAQHRAIKKGLLRVPHAFTTASPL